LSLVTRIDRYLARLIFVPMVATLTLAAMLLLLEKMLRLFDFVVSEGGPVNVVWQMLANLIPEYLSLGIPLGLMLGHPDRFPEARFVVGARQPARRRPQLRAAAARALYVRDRARRAEFRHRRLPPALRPV
jgi:hypothetical protein